jgi:outer membrane protein assembly factor BamC
MRRLAVLGILLASATAGGCGWLVGDEGVFRDRGDEYRKAQSIPPMKPPEGKRTEAVEELYAIPVERTDVLLGKEFEVPRPQPLVADPEQNVVRIQKLGEDQWILLDGAPGEVWPRVRAFLISNQIGIEREDAAAGALETGWLVFRDNAERRERYRFRVEQGVQRNSTEVYITQSGYTKPEGEERTPPEWADRSVDKERETFMLKELAGFLADTSQSGSVSLLAQGISTTNKVYLVRDASGRPAIDLRLPFERAWASLGRALPRAEFRVRDLDRSAGIYYVTYEPGTRDEGEAEASGEGDGTTPRPEPEEKGFFSGMFDWWGDDEDNPAKGRDYRVEMREAEGGVTIGVVREDGSDFEEGEVEFLLSLVKAHLA